MMINCDACNGRKMVIGLGNLQKKCPDCNGVGWLTLPDEDMKVTLGDVLSDPKRKKKKPIIEPVLQCES